MGSPKGIFLARKENYGTSSRTQKQSSKNLVDQLVKDNWIFITTARLAQARGQSTPTRLSAGALTRTINTRHQFSVRFQVYF